MSKPRTAFTIIELIIVIAIIGVLIAILLPSLRGVQRRARKVKEVTLISHVGKAWSMYSVDHRDKILPGYISPEAQAKEKLAWAFPDESLVPPAPDYGTSLPNDAGPWTFRLLDYFDYDWKSLMFYRDLEWTSGELREHADVIATEPAFGYNGFYLGGWQEIDNHSNRIMPLFHSVAIADGERTNVVTSNLSAIPRASHQIVFCSTFFASQGIHQHLPDDAPGTFMSIPSVLARVTKWWPLASDKIDARFDTSAPLGRFNGMPAISFADGSSRAVELIDLLDQSMWIPSARQVGDIPATEFSHTVN